MNRETKDNKCITCGKECVLDNLEYDEVCTFMHHNQHHSCARGEKRK